MKKINWKKLILITLVTIFVGSFFAFFNMDGMKEFANLDKPFLAPPGIVFMIAWFILYVLMSISVYMISESNNPNKKDAISIYILQLIINSLWTLFFFGLKVRLLAFFWIILLIIVVISMIISFSKINKTAAKLQIPYIIWLFFAAYLTISVYLLNR